MSCRECPFRQGFVTELFRGHFEWEQKDESHFVCCCDVLYSDAICSGRGFAGSIALKFSRISIATHWETSFCKQENPGWL